MYEIWEFIKPWVRPLHYIYIHAQAFIQSDLQCIAFISLFPGNQTHAFNAMLYHLSHRNIQEQTKLLFCVAKFMEKNITTEEIEQQCVPYDLSLSVELNVHLNALGTFHQVRHLSDFGHSGYVECFVIFLRTQSF